MAFEQCITDESALREVYREPHELVLRKASPIIDDGARSFIERSPFFVFATSNGRGTDASPRGGPAGFVSVLDEHRLAWGDLAGNNRLDSFRNLLDQPTIAMLFFIPGLGETLRVNGTASLTRDPSVLDATSIDGRRPHVAVGIDVACCFIHCAKALRRSALWEPDTWPHPSDRPSPSAILKAHVELDTPVEAIEASLEEGYAATMWTVAGDHVTAER
jgi:PPOX class probable FMN-dependent enzyme